MKRFFSFSLLFFLYVCILFPIKKGGDKMKDIVSSDVISKIFGISTSTLNKRIETERFPSADFSVGRVRFWKKETILSVLEDETRRINRMKMELEGDFNE